MCPSAVIGFARRVRCRRCAGWSPVWGRHESRRERLTVGEVAVDRRARDTPHLGDVGGRAALLPKLTGFGGVGRRPPCGGVHRSPHQRVFSGGSRWNETEPVDNHLLGKLDRISRISSPPAADGETHDGKHRSVVEHPLGPLRQRVRGEGVGNEGVNTDGDLSRGPIHPVGVKALGRIERRRPVARHS